MPKKILLADDSITIQKVISITFAAEDYELTIVGDGDAAIEKVKEIKPDLVIADVAMPGKTGYQVCDLIKNDPTLRGIPVILLSGTFEPLNREEAQRVKADGNIVKPFESQELIDKVRELLTGAQVEAEAKVEAIPAPAIEAQAAEKAEVSQDIWEAGDFLGFPEEFEEKKETKEAELAPDLDFLEGGLFEEPAKEFSLPEADEFLGVSSIEEKPGEGKPYEPARKEAIQPEAFELGPFEVEEFKPESVAGEPFKIEPFEFEPSKEEAKKPSEELTWFNAEPEEKPLWSEPQIPEPVKAEPVNQVETDLLEVPQEAIAEEAPKWEPRPAFETAVKEEERFEPAVTERIVEEATEKAEEKLKEDLGGRLEGGLNLPREQIEEIVRRAAREVVEEIAWEVVPDLAEELIKAELNKIREAFSKIK